MVAAASRERECNATDMMQQQHGADEVAASLEWAVPGRQCSSASGRGLLFY